MWHHDGVRQMRGVTGATSETDKVDSCGGEYEPLWSDPRVQGSEHVEEDS